jgi:hypothetical protein
MTESPLGGAVTVIVMSGAAPLASSAVVSQVTIVSSCLQPQCRPAADTNVAPSGSVSMTRMACAWLGPWFVTVIWNVSVPLVSARSVPVIAIETSALPRIVVSIVTELFEVRGSAVAAPTVAMSGTFCGVLGPTAAIAIAGASPSGSEATVHVTTFATLLHVQPGPVALTNASSVGSVLVTVTAVAVLGPWFVTTIV